MTTTEKMSLLLTDRQAAVALGVSRRTLQAWRLINLGPQITRVGPRLVRYKVEDINNWIDKSAVGVIEEVGNEK
jgi:predicted DNA-binding transcriptional regulator AlpA